MRLKEGIITAQITPCAANGEPDFGALGELIAFQQQAGVAGLFVLGSAGLGPLMTITERKRALERIITLAGPLAVVAHIGAAQPAEAVDLARHAEAAGAAAVSSVPPTYYQPDFLVVADYYKRLRAAVTLPLIAYNNPPATGYHLTPDQTASLFAADVIHGVKQSHPSVAELHALLAAGVRVWAANATLCIDALAMGAFGAISTITNVAPEAFVMLAAALQRGDLKAARHGQQAIDFIAGRLRHPTIGALHAGVSERGLPGLLPRAPLRMPDEAETRPIREAVARAREFS
ncbi:MAG TPA: dihydrodipicolinate synthase family protein [Bauldia sp.]|nr:dihydrodipicolinate synthase family protein [Bauldia sp.]